MPVTSLQTGSDKLETSGVYASLQNLLHMRLLAKELNLSKQRKILSSQTGTHASKFRGRGIDFSEVRAYQSGDDIRSIDWRVTARTGKPHTKLYSEERERPTLIILDQTQSMFFGSQTAFKSVLAAQAAALLSWAVLNRGDRIGGIVFSDIELNETRPRRSHHSVLQFIENILTFNHRLNKNNSPSTQTTEGSASGKNRLAESLLHARRTTKPGSELFIISDFLEFDEACRQHLFQLSRHNDLVCIWTYDYLETELPQTGIYNVSNGQQTTTLDLFDKNIRERYQIAFKERIDLLQTQLEQMKIPLLKMATNQPPLETLQRGLGIRRGGK